MNEHHIISAPWGHVQLDLNDNMVTRLVFKQGQKEERSGDQCLSDAFAHYFADATQPINVRYELSGTEFQIKVWSALKRIPPGQVRTYTELAEMVGSGPRAVANACRRNPCPLIIPCHRVVAKNGIGGFAGQTDGWLLDIKNWLLAHEGYFIAKK